MENNFHDHFTEFKETVEKLKEFDFVIECGPVCSTINEIYDLVEQTDNAIYAGLSTFFSDIAMPENGDGMNTMKESTFFEIIPEEYNYWKVYSHVWENLDKYTACESSVKISREQITELNEKTTQFNEEFKSFVASSDFEPPEAPETYPDNTTPQAKAFWENQIVPDMEEIDEQPPTYQLVFTTLTEKVIEEISRIQNAANAFKEAIENWIGLGLTVGITIAKVTNMFYFPKIEIGDKNLYSMFGEDLDHVDFYAPVYGEVYRIVENLKKTYEEDDDDLLALNEKIKHDVLEHLKVKSESEELLGIVESLIKELCEYVPPEEETEEKI